MAASVRTANSTLPAALADREAIAQCDKEELQKSLYMQKIIPGLLNLAFNNHK